MREDMAFISKGLRCSGWLYTPDGLGPGQKAPAIVMAHGFSAVKEMYLANFAEQFVAAGFVTLVFDYRFLGASEGEPRGQVLPLEHLEDYRNAITWLGEHPRVDPDRIGAWGTSLSGGIVLVLARLDPRVKAVVAQVPGAYNCEARRRMDPVRYDQLTDLFIKDRVARHKTGVVNYMRVVDNQGGECALRPPDACEWFSEASKIAPNWLNGVTIESLEKMQREFDPVSLLHMAAPTPIMMVVAQNDSLIPFEVSLAAYEKVGEPKALSVLPCGHFDVYHREPWFSKSCGSALDWFTTHLQPAR